MVIACYRIHYSFQNRVTLPLTLPENQLVAVARYCPALPLTSGVPTCKFCNPDPIRNFFIDSIPIHIRKYKIMDSDIKSKSETAQSIAQ